MNLQQLEYLLKIVECGSISKAAHQLYLSQPSLSKSIASLEAEYGIQIFLRTPKGVILTERGRDFVNLAKRVMMTVDTINLTFLGNKNKKNTLSIATQQLDFIYDIMLDIYKQHDPHTLHMDLFETDRGSVINSLLNQVANIGLVVLTEADSKEFQRHVKTEGLEAHLLDSSGIFLSMGPKSPFYNRESISYEETIGISTILLDAEESTKLELSIEQNISNSLMSPSFYCNTVNACYVFLHKANMHLYTPKWVLGMFKDSIIRSIPVTPTEHYPCPTNELLWLKRVNEPLSDIERAFIDLLKLRFN